MKSPSEHTRQDGAPEGRAAVVCPHCGRGYRIAARLIGKRLVCKECREEWRASEVSADALRSARRRSRDESPSDSRSAGFKTEMPPRAGSSSVAIDMSWVSQRIGRYRVSSLLGHGGMGVVWRAHDESLRRDVALKILTQRREEGARGGLNLDLFMQEARAVAKLQHPAVVSIYEVAEDQGHVFLALELMEGGTLKEFVDREGPIEPRRLFEWMVGPTKALALAHRRGVVHRDIKPSNLMFDDHGHLKLMDFGLADVTDEAVSERLRGKAVGSLGWIAPETALGKGSTELSDAYSLGLVMLYALTGKPFIHAKSRSAMIALHQHPPPIKFEGVNGLTASGERLLRKCLAVDPSERFVSTEELATALQACADEDPVARRQQTKTGVLIAVSAMLIGAVVVLFPLLNYVLDLVERQDQYQQPVGRSVTYVEPPAPEPAALAPAPPAAADQKDLHVPWPEVYDEADLKFIGSKRGRVFHRPGGQCGARRILASNLVRFETAAEAIESGRTPCPQCHPEDEVGSQPSRRPDVVKGPDSGDFD